jgi:aspartyl protease family protein
MSEDPGHAPYSHKLGSTMTLLAWVLLLGLLTVLFSAYLDKESNPNTQVVSRTVGSNTEILLDQNRQGHYVATAAFNGLPVDIMIDTGATEVSVPGTIAERIGLVRGAVMEVSTANGTIPVYATMIDSIQIGEIVLHNVRANINTYMDEEFVLLGMSFLKRVEFSQKQGQLILTQTE